MKKLLITLSLLICILFVACKKDSVSGSSAGNTTGNTSSVRYEFTADVPAAYRISTLTGTLNYDETISGTSFTKTVTSPQRTAAGDTARLIVFAPDSWMNTANQANVNLKIFVDNNLKGSKSFVLTWIDRPSGNELNVAY